MIYGKNYNFIRYTSKCFYDVQQFGVFNESLLPIYRMSVDNNQTHRK